MALRKTCIEQEIEASRVRSFPTGYFAALFVYTRAADFKGNTRKKIAEQHECVFHQCAAIIKFNLKTAPKATVSDLKVDVKGAPLILNNH